MKKGQRGLLFVVFVVILVVALFYSYTNGMLPLTSMNYAKWDVHFDKLSVSTVGEATYTEPVFSNTIVTGQKVSVVSPGDSVTFQFQVVNNGTMEAQLADIVMSIPKCVAKRKNDSTAVCDELRYELREEDGKLLESDFSLAPRSSKLVKLVVEYPTYGENLTQAVEIENLDVDLIFKRV